MKVIKDFSVVIMIRNYCYVIVNTHICAEAKQAFESLTKTFLKTIYDFTFEPTSVSIY